MTRYNSKASLSVGMGLLRYQFINEHYPDMDPIENHNLFIPLEPIIDRIIKVQNIQHIMRFHKRQLILDLESSILNLCAHYKGYFKYRKCPVHIVLYYTDWNSDFPYCNDVNEYYRSTYCNKLKQNPSYRLIAELLSKVILPEVQTIITYLEDVHLISTIGIDSLVVPGYYYEKNPNKYPTSIILTESLFDTLYLWDDRFKVWFMKRTYEDGPSLYKTTDEILSYIIGETNVPFMSSEILHRILLACMGDIDRNLHPIKINYEKILKIFNSNPHLHEYKNIELLKDKFPNNIYSELQKRLQLIDLEFHKYALNDSMQDHIDSQIINKSDVKSLHRLARERFSDFPINLDFLL